MLSQLRHLHDELRSAIAELALVVRQPMLDKDALSSARLRVTKLSRQRRSLIQCTILPSLHDVPRHEAQRINQLVLEAAELAVGSSEHIARWTMAAISGDWTGYQQASAEMRASMLKRIRFEAVVLYPILEARSGQKAA